MHCLEENRKREEKVKGDYDSQPPGLEGGPSDVACHEDVFSNPVFQGPNIVKQDNESVSQRVTTFVNEFADIR